MKSISSLGLRRHITVVTSPNENGVLGFATRMRDSAFKRTLRELPVGSEVQVEPPKGSFGLPQDPSRPLVFVAGGIGITVFRSVLRSTTCASSSRRFPTSGSSSR